MILKPLPRLAQTATLRIARIARDHAPTVKLNRLDALRAPRADGYGRHHRRPGDQWLGSATTRSCFNAPNACIKCSRRSVGSQQITTLPVQAAEPRSD